MFSLGFGPVDLIVAGTCSRADSVEEIGGILSGLAADPMHRMNHMAGWLRRLPWRCRVGSGASSGFWSSVSEGFSREQSAAGVPAVQRTESRLGWLAVSACVKGEPLDASEHKPCPGVYRD